MVGGQLILKIIRLDKILQMHATPCATPVPNKTLYNDDIYEPSCVNLIAVKYVKLMQITILYYQNGEQLQVEF